MMEFLTVLPPIRIYIMLSKRMVCFLFIEKKVVWIFNFSIQLPFSFYFTLDRFFSRVFHSYEDDGRVIMKDCAQWDSV